MRDKYRDRGEIERDRGERYGREREGGREREIGEREKEREIERQIGEREGERGGRER